MNTEIVHHVAGRWDRVGYTVKVNYNVRKVSNISAAWVLIAVATIIITIERVIGLVTYLSCEDIIVCLGEK